MADSYTKLGLGGVDLVRGKYYPNDQTVLGAQNAEMVLDKALGGRASLRKRGGLIDHGTAFGGGIFDMSEVRIIDEVISGVTEIMRPVSDFSNTNFTPTPLYAQLDEVTPSDSDFITASNPSNVAIVGMTLVSFTGVATLGTLRIRFRKTGVLAGSGQIQVLDGATVIASKTIPEADWPASFTTFEWNIFTDFNVNYDSHSFNWSDVQVYFSGIPAGIGGTVDCSWIELELSHA